MNHVHVKQLKQIRACNSAVEFAAKFESLQQAWDACKRPDWMFWLIGKTSQSAAWSDDRKPLVLCALECAETVKHFWSEKNREQIEAAIGVLKSWCNGEVSLQEAQAARNSLRAIAVAAIAVAVAAIAVAADADAAAAAVVAVAADADAAAAAVVAAVVAADAAAAAVVAAVVAAAAADVRAQCASIIRAHYPHAPQMEVA